MNTNLLLGLAAAGTLVAGCMYYGIKHGPGHEQIQQKPHEWKWLSVCKHRWFAIQNLAHRHHRSFHRVHGATHLGYFTLVFTHGPYNLVAGGLIILILLGWVLKLEDY